MTEAKAGNTPLKFARSLLGPRVIGSGKNGRIYPHRSEPQNR